MHTLWIPGSGSSYLGHIVGGGEVKVEMSKVKAIRRIQPSKTKKEVRTFLGLPGKYRKLILNYATIATVLTDLTWKSQPNQTTWTTWTTDCEKAFR